MHNSRKIYIFTNLESHTSCENPYRKYRNELECPN